jgi:hypothetical protein
LRDLDAADLARRLTLADLVLRPIGIGWLRVVVLALAVLGLVLPSAARRVEFWLALALLEAWRVVATWPLADNHAYLLGYWCLALAIASLDPDPRPALAWSGRMLIGLVFALAVLAKASSPDYLDGRFFRVTLLTDERLAPFARVAGGLGPDELSEQHARLTEHVDGPAAAEANAWRESARFDAVVRGATLGSFAWEALVALAFLWPVGRGPSRIRDPLLMLFCATTYLVAPVAGFGWLLIALGVAQTDAARWRTRAAYVAVFGLVFLYREIPWESLGLG